MANLIKISSSGGGGATQGFINIPEGDWIFKSTKGGSVFPGFSENTIPMVKNMTGHATNGWSENSQIGFSGSCTISVNNETAASATASKSANVGSQNWGIDITVNCVFLPFFYNMDLTLTQQSETSGNIVVWLEKQ